jgi:hypothetical protein
VAPIPLPLLSVDQVTVAGPPDEFQQLVAGSVGDISPELDGFDADVLVVAGLLDADTNGLGELDGLLGLMDFTPGDFDAGQIGPVITDAGQVVAGGNALVDDFDGSISPPK